MHDIPWPSRITQQEALQEFTSLSISSTVNVPNETTVEEIKELYLTAMRSRILKGVTVYRDGSIQFAPMTMTKNTKDALPDTMPSESPEKSTYNADGGKTQIIDLKSVEKASEKIDKHPADTEYGEYVVRRKFKRPSRTVGATIEMAFTDGVYTDKYYITVNEDENFPGRPIEVFISGGRHGETAPAMNQALGRMISGWLQDGAPVRSVIKKLVGIRGDQRARVRFCADDVATTQVLSIPDGVGKYLQRKYMDKREVLSIKGGSQCPKCYHNTFKFSADGQKCWQCHNPDCGETICGGG